MDCNSSDTYDFTNQSEPSLERSLQRIVRTVIRRGHGPSNLSQQILDAAKSLPHRADRSAEQVVRLVSRKLYDKITTSPSAAMSPGTRRFDTIRGRTETTTRL
ncbi:MAG: hypothetical protein IH991_16575 [Planctomycetes bacterium]|nr:hypothetical protein [Planctomycetota bacterium]